LVLSSASLHDEFCGTRHRLGHCATHRPPYGGEILAESAVGRGPLSISRWVNRLPKERYHEHQGDPALEDNPDDEH